MKKTKQKNEAHAKFLSLSKDEAREFILKYGDTTTRQIEMAKDWKENHISVDSVMDEGNWLGGDNYSWHNESRDSITTKNRNVGHSHLKGVVIGLLVSIFSVVMIAISCWTSDYAHQQAQQEAVNQDAAQNAGNNAAINKAGDIAQSSTNAYNGAIANDALQVGIATGNSGMVNAGEAMLRNNQ